MTNARLSTADWRARFVILTSCAVLWLAANVLVAKFVLHERYVYFWDWAGYWNEYIELSRLFRESVGLGILVALIETRISDYGPLPILPLVPLQWLLGDGRLGYVLGLTNLFIVPAAFAFAALAQQLQQTHSPRSNERCELSAGFVLASASTLALSSLWVPALRGQPDGAGLILAVISLWYLQRGTVVQPPVRSLVAQGVVLGLLVLVRRWYAYWAVAYFPAVLAAAAVADLFEGRSADGSRTLEAARRLLVVGATLVAVVGLIATPMVARVLTANYDDVYSAYDWNGSRLLDVVAVVRYFGAAELAFAAAGLTILASRASTRRLAVFLVVQPAIAFGHFTNTQDMVAHHYYLLFPSVAIGVAVLVLTLYRTVHRPGSRALAAGVVLVVAAGSAVAFMDIGGDITPRFRTPQRPFVRSDLSVIAGLWDRIAHLDGVTDGKVYVVASSDTLNADLLLNYCSHHGGLSRKDCSFIMRTSDVDKRDGFPYGFFLSRYVVVASPVQYHLNPNGQRVVGVLARELSSGVALGASYRRLPQIATLDGGVEVAIYERIEPISPAAANSVIAELQSHYPENASLFKPQ